MKRSVFYGAMSLLLSLASCTDQATKPQISSNFGAHDQREKAILRAVHQMVQKGLIKEASSMVSRLVLDDPDNQFLHLLSGFLYEMLLDAGEKSAKELALVAYETAYKIDPTRFLAAQKLALMYMRTGQYRKAQDFCAIALLLKRDDKSTLHALALASYYARDPLVGAAAMKRVLGLAPNDIALHESAVVIFAAANLREEALKSLKKLESAKSFSKNRVDFLKQRMQDWQDLFARAQKELQTPSSAAQNSAAELKDDKSAKKLEDGEQTIVVDCYLLRVSDNDTTTKGLDLLTRLSAISPSNTGGLKLDYSGNNDRSKNLNGPSISTDTVASKFTWNFSNVQYFLNIANSTNNRVEVLARPTMTLSLNKKASFLSGNEYKSAVSGQNSGAVVGVFAGVRVEVVLTKLKKDRVTMDVTLEGSLQSAEPQAGNGFTSQVMTLGQTKVTTTTTLDFNEVGILGGIYERTDRVNQSGTPFLEDIPILQYAFSNENSTSLRKHVLFMIVPREKKDASADINLYKSVGNTTYMSIWVQTLLKRGMLSPLTPPANISSILNGLHKLAYEFRTGDIALSQFTFHMQPYKKLEKMESFWYY